MPAIFAKDFEPPKIKARKLPSKEGTAIDEVYKIKMALSKANRLVDELKAEKARLENEMLKKFNRKKLSGALSKLAVLEFVPKEKPQIEPKNRKKFENYVAKHKCFELMSKSINETAINERLQDGHKMPFVTFHKYNAVSIRKKA